MVAAFPTPLRGVGVGVRHDYGNCGTCPGLPQPCRSSFRQLRQRRYLLWKPLANLNKSLSHAFRVRTLHKPKRPSREPAFQELFNCGNRSRVGRVPTQHVENHMAGPILGTVIGAPLADMYASLHFSCGLGAHVREGIWPAPRLNYTDLVARIFWRQSIAQQNASQPPPGGFIGWWREIRLTARDAEVKPRILAPALSASLSVIWRSSRAERTAAMRALAPRASSAVNC